MKIAFHTEQIDVRGTCVAIYDYAYYSETLLKNESFIVCNKNNKNKNDSLAVKKFLNRFNVFFYTSIEELQKWLDKMEIPILYSIKYGKKDKLCKLKRIKTIVHCVFDMSEPHGDRYLAVSETLAKKYNSTDFLPHMIGLKPSITGENLRKALDISEEAIVFGRYGGNDTFDIPFVVEIIKELVRKRQDVYFLFMNTPVFDIHPQIIFLDSVVYESEKNLFISTCDAHLECGTLGHSFGLSIGEFSVNNKPIIAYISKSLWNTSHLQILGDKGIYFRNKNEFKNILENFKKMKNTDLNCYREYSPEIIMRKFEEILNNL